MKTPATAGGSAPRLDVSISRPAGSRAGAGLAAWLTGAAPRSARGGVAIALVSDARMRQMNARFRKIDRATDVLSFPADDDGVSQPMATGKKLISKDLGDIAIALGVARRQAREHGHALGTELRILALHGLLHLLGYDHERDRGEMHRFEERLRRKAGLSQGLIARARDSSRRPTRP